MASKLYIGLMSGTSLDGIDCVLVDLSKLQLISSLCRPFPPKLADLLRQLCNSDSSNMESGAIADRLLGEEYARAVLDLLLTENLKAKDICAIGCHGQTIRHCPPRAGDCESGFTIQIGDANTIVQRTGITVVADFRSRDIAAGGQGAPLAPAFHQAAFSNSAQNRVIVNIGGISNITILSKEAAVAGYDTGPGNTLMDNWIRANRDLNFDSGGQWARAGRINSKLLQQLLQHPFFALAAPKSTGTEEFSMDWLASVLKNGNEAIADADVQATLLELTAVSISQEIRGKFGSGAGVYVCGGGANNSMLMERLSDLLRHHQVQTTDDLGIGPAWVEAAAFAWLASQCLENIPANLPEVTGATERVVLGAIYPGPSLH